MIPVHLAKGSSGDYVLREETPGNFQWFLHGKAVGVNCSSLKDSLKSGFKSFKNDQFRPLHCGTKFSLPERDEHGEPAIFSELVRSLASSNGQYYDPLYGQNFIVKEYPTLMRDYALSFLKS